MAKKSKDKSDGFPPLGEPMPVPKDEKSEVKEVPKEVPKAAPSPQKVISLEDRKFPLNGFVRGKGPLGQAFVAEMKIKDQGKTVKRTRSEWTKLYEAFLKAPRG